MRLLHAGLAAALALGLSAGHAGAGEDRGAPAGRFDFYVLSLSWSASWCRTTGERRNARQCDIGRNPGFVLHGLWPQYERGYPSYCTPEGRNPGRAAMDEATRVFPDPGLARHQWQKHGSCAGLSPGAYFEAARRARERIAIPNALIAPERDANWSVREIERAFVAANPGLRVDMMAVTCRRGALEEVRVCLTRDLRAFRACPEVSRDSCRTREVNVPAAR